MQQQLMDHTGVTEWPHRVAILVCAKFPWLFCKESVTFCGVTVRLNTATSSEQLKQRWSTN